MKELKKERKKKRREIKEMKKKRRHAEMNEDELDDLANDMRLIKKLRKGKVCTSQYLRRTNETQTLWSVSAEPYPQ